MTEKENDKQRMIQALNAKKAIVRDSIRDVSMELLELKQELSDIDEKLASVMGD